MKRQLVASMLSLAVAGCAQSRVDPAKPGRDDAGAVDLRHGQPRDGGRTACQDGDERPG